MENTKTKTRRLSEILIPIIVLICMTMLVLDVGINLYAEMNSRENLTAIEVIQETPTAVPTLTEEEYQEFIGIENAGGQPTPIP